MSTQIFLKDEKCPVCNSEDKKLLGHPLMKNEKFNAFQNELKDVEIVRCLNCNLLYIYPIVHYSDEFLNDLYPVEYWGDDKDKDFKNMKDKRSILKIAINHYKENLSNKKLLDIGCGMGEFLKIASENGIEPLGIDLNKTTTDYITQKYGYPTINALINEDTFEENTFDFVVLSHVIEHVQDPNKLIHIIYKILKPNGIFIMATPNASSLISQLYDLVKKIKHGKKYSFIITPFIIPYHILGFNKLSAKKLLKKNNFKIIYNKAQPTFFWKGTKYKIFFVVLKTIAALFGKGEQLVSISKKSSL
jgi:2-polyprenyl-3-methyl-5-hydroxy-6-metoxy-1,4-benzoquinol methylase